MRKIAWFFLLLAPLALAPFAGHAADEKREVPPFKKSEVVIRTKHADLPFTVELAETYEQQELGLQRRTTMPKDHGMLFLSPKGKDQRMIMWMKDTQIPLDMFFLNKAGQIVYIYSNARPNSTNLISARDPVRAVLEVRAGTAKALRIYTKDYVIHPAFSKGRAEVKKAAEAKKAAAALPPGPEQRVKNNTEANIKEQPKNKDGKKIQDEKLLNNPE